MWNFSRKGGIFRSPGSFMQVSEQVASTLKDRVFKETEREVFHLRRHYGVKKFALAGVCSNAHGRLCARFSKRTEINSQRAPVESVAAASFVLPAILFFSHPSCIPVWCRWFSTILTFCTLLYLTTTYLLCSFTHWLVDHTFQGLDVEDLKGLAQFRTVRP